MTTAEMLDFVTEFGPMGDVYSVYRGPCSPRQTLRECHKAGDLLFSVNRSRVSLGIGEPTVRAYHAEFADALAMVETLGKGWRISAHCRGWGFPEEGIIFASWCNPLGLEI